LSYDERKSYSISFFSSFVLAILSIPFLCAAEGTSAFLIQSENTHDSVPEESPILNSDILVKLNLPFIENQGQLSDEVTFYANTFAGNVFVTQDDISYSFIKSALDDDGSNQGVVVKESFLGSTMHAFQPRGLDKSNAIVNYFVGEKESWRSNVPTYNAVGLGEIWPSIDVELKAYGNNIEKIFSVRPGGSVEDIMLALEGVKSLSLSEEGELLLETELGTIAMTRPLAFQDIAGMQIPVDVFYVLKDNTYGFEVANYNPNYNLFIDPLLSSTLIGGTGTEVVRDIAVDSSGNVFVAGFTTGSLPTTVGAYDETHNGALDATVSKLNSDLTSLMASTFLGGTSTEQAFGIAIDGSDNVFVTGATGSGDYPTTPRAYDETFNGLADAIVSKLKNDLTLLLASTYVGGAGNDQAFRITIDGSGNVYFAGLGASGYPTTLGAYDRTFNGASDATVTKLNNGLSSLLASTFIGGTGTDQVVDIALDSSGNVFVAGSTGSGDYPTTPGAYDETYNGGTVDVGVSKLSNDLTSLMASTYIGGTSNDSIGGIAIDSSDNLFVTGTAQPGGYPTTVGAYDETHNGGDDAFVSKINNALTVLMSSTFIGGISSESGRNIVIDSSGNVFVTGATGSGDYPTTPGAYDQTFNGPFDVIITKLNNGLSLLLASTFIGGTANDEATGIVLDSSGNVLVAGSTTGSYPTTSGAYDETPNGSEDAFVSKFTSDLAAVSGTVPGAPIALSATAASSSQIDLFWLRPGGPIPIGFPIIGYEISRESPTGGGFSTLVANTGSILTSYSDMGLAAGTEYNYKVSAINAIGTGPPSNEASATTTPTVVILTWTGGAVDGLWSSPANWDSGVPTGTEEIVLMAPACNSEPTSTSLDIPEFGLFGTLQIGLGCQVDISGISITVGDGGLVSNQGTINVNDGGFVAVYDNGAVVNANGAVINVNEGELFVGDGGKVTNGQEGDINIFSSGTLTTEGDITEGGGYLVNAAFKTIYIDGTFFNDGVFDNQGHVEIDCNGTISGFGQVNNFFGLIEDVCPPSSVIASTFLGNEDNESISSMVRSPTGTIYVVGTITEVDAYSDIFVKRLSPDLQTIEFGFIIAGDGTDRANSVALDSEGNVYVTGFTDSADFPTTTGDQILSASAVFVMKLDPSLGGILASTFLDGGLGEGVVSDYETGNAIAINDVGKVYVTGYTTNPFFPTTSGVYSQTFSDEVDVFVSRLSADLATLEASTFVGGCGEDKAEDMAIDSSGNVVITGYASYGDCEPPAYPTTTGAFDTLMDTSSEGFISKLNPNLTMLLASTFVGGENGFDEAYSIALDSDDNIYIAGYTDSDDIPVFISPFVSFQSELSGPYDAFVAKMSSDLTDLLASTYLGGFQTVDEETAEDIAVDSFGNVIVVGRTDSVDDFPTTPGETSTLDGSHDAFVSKLSNDLSTLIGSTYLGGNAFDGANTVALDEESDGVYVAGTTESVYLPATVLEEEAGAQTYFGGESDGFVSLLDFPPAVSRAEITGPNEATILYNEAVIATDPLNDYCDLFINGELEARPITNVNQDIVNAHVITFDGDPVGDDATGTISINACSETVEDYGGNPLPPQEDLPLTDGQANDSDDDGIPDNLDACPDAPETYNGFQDEDGCPDVVSTNGKIAFDSSRDGNFEIYTMNSNGLGQKRLTNNPATDYAPDWSPDGTKIVFTSNRDGGDLEIYIMNSDGTEQTRLTTSVGFDEDPRWSPDGTKIAFHSGRDGDFEIYTMNADGSDQTNISNDAANDQSPSWSPDGTKIAFASTRGAGDYEIFTMNSDDGSEVAQLTDNAEGDQNPHWSPDGTKITFMHGIAAGGDDIYSMNFDGTNQIRLTDNLVIDGSPSWSPDGTKIVFYSIRDGNNEIYSMNSDGNLQTRLTSNGASDTNPSWGIAPNDPVITLDKETYSPLDNIHIAITDFTIPTATQDVTLRNLNSEESITVTVAEISEGSGDFNVHDLVQLTSTGTTDDEQDILQVNHLDVIEASYESASSNPTDTAEVRIAGLGIEPTEDARIVFDSDVYNLESGGTASVNLVGVGSYTPPNVLSTGQAASAVLGQSAFNTKAAPATPTASSLNQIRDFAFDPAGNLWVVDTNNHRILRYDAPFTNGEAATGILGRTSFTTNTAPPTNPTASTLNTPREIAFDSAGNLWVVDSGNHRILRYTAPFTNGEAATAVLGQAGFTTKAAPATPTASSLNSPRSLVFDAAGNLFVADSLNHRILRYTAPFTNGEAATAVLGQAGFTTKAAPATPTASSLNTPRTLAFDASGNLFVADQINHRILRYDAPFTNGEAATAVIGQSAFNTKVAPNPPSVSSLNSPRGIVFDSRGALFVSDTLNNRILEYLPPFSNGQPAFAVMGQTNFITGTAAATPTASSLNNPRGLGFDASGNLWVADTLNHRAIRYAPSDGINTVQVYVTKYSETEPGGLTLNAVETTATSRVFVTPTILFTAGATSSNPIRLGGLMVDDQVFATNNDIPSGESQSISATIIPSPAQAGGGVPIAIFTDRIDCLLVGNPADDPDPSPDNDADGICDIFEDQNDHDGLQIPYGTQLYTYAGSCRPQIDDVTDPTNPAYEPFLAPSCPDPNVKDIYLEIDYMAGHKPPPDAIRQVVQAFANQGINLHVVVDENLGFHTEETDYDEVHADFTQEGFKQLKQRYFGTVAERSSLAGNIDGLADLITAKRNAFHYMMIIHKIENSQASGWAEIIGNDIIIAGGVLSGQVGTTDEMAGTIMHELGHNLGLRHSGNTDYPNCEPNYLSRMNYLYQLGNFVPGLDFPLDYSRTSMNPINENNLNDAIGIRPNSQPSGLNAVVGGIVGENPLAPTLAPTGSSSTFNWNRVAGQQSGYSQNVHYVDISDCRDSSIQTLTSYADWPNLNLIFTFEANFLDGIYPALDEINTEEIANLQSLGIAALDVTIRDLPDEAFDPNAGTPEESREIIRASLVIADDLIEQDGDLNGAADHLETVVRPLIVERIENVSIDLPYEDDVLTLLDDVIDLLRDLASQPADTEQHSAPSAANLAGTVPFETPTTITLVGDDPDNTPVTYMIVTPPPATSGTLGSIDQDTGQVTFTPAPLFTGETTFTYKVTSDGEDSNIATVFITVLAPPPSPVTTTWHLDKSSSGTLFLNPLGPTSIIPKSADSGSISRSGGNPYKAFGTWKAPAPVGTPTQYLDFSGVFSLKTLKDIKAKFDIKVEVFRNNDGELLAAGELLCQNSIQVMFPVIKELKIPLVTNTDTHFDAENELLLKVSTRMGTNADGFSCGGNSSAKGLLLWYDAKKVDSLFGTSILLDP